MGGSGNEQIYDPLQENPELIFCRFFPVFMRSLYTMSHMSHYVALHHTLGRNMQNNNKENEPVANNRLYKSNAGDRCR